MTLLYLISINIISCKCSLIFIRFYVFFFLKLMQEDRYIYIYIYIIFCIFLELQINMIILHRPPNQKFLATSLGHAYLLQHPPKSQPNPYATYKRTCFDFVKIMDVSYGFHAFSRDRDGRLLER